MIEILRDAPYLAAGVLLGKSKAWAEELYKACRMGFLEIRNGKFCRTVSGNSYLNNN
jgi:hypothetical protein